MHVSESTVQLYMYFSCYDDILTWVTENSEITILENEIRALEQAARKPQIAEEASNILRRLTGGELAAMVLLDAVIRLRPGVLGNAESTAEESFARGLLEAPHYTRPQVWEGRAIPEVLLSGHHARIAEWRADQAERLTRERRPDLWAAWEQSQHAEHAPEQSDAQNKRHKGEQKE